VSGRLGWDRQLGGVRVLAEMCATCIFRPGNLMQLQPGRVRGMVAATRPSRDHRRQPTASHIPCHDTIYREDVRPAICRGFFDLPDRPNSPRPQLLQVGDRLGWWVYVDPPGEGSDG
jgi:hypothetical protein